ncbi:ABC transporter ATP-binding protein [candidate division KSB1 bacterium]|nr:MAG: ABC transporter ATP-binding protein [candidate division KSB1 bacterium]
MITYLKFINPFQRYPMQLVGTALCTLFYVSFNAISLWLVAPVLTVIFQPGKAAATPVPLGDIGGWYETAKAWTWNLIGGSDPANMLPRLCITLIVVFAIKNIFAYGQMHFVSFVEQRMIRDLRRLVFEHLARQPYSFYDKRPTGELMSNIMNDVNVISVAFQRVFTQVVRDPLTVLTLLILLISISWQLTALAAIIVPLFGVIYRYTGQSLKRKSGRIQAYLGEMSTHLQEAISGARVVKAFGTERHEISRFERRNAEVFRHSLRLVRLDRLAQPLSETIGVMIIALVLLIGGQQVLSGQLLDAEDFIRYIVLLFSILAPIRGVGGIHNNLQVGAAAGTRLNKILSEPPEAMDTGTKEITTLSKDIVFDHVSFRYETTPDWILKDIELTIRRNEKIALVGRSGSGKSTLANLIPRFYTPQQGRILIDGVLTDEITLRSLRRLVSTVSQDVFLFNESVRYNIAYGLECVDDARLNDVIRQAQAADFIAALPHGLDTVVGERGTQLSGGQRQRIAIARALLRNSPLLIFDEATSSLDSESERLIQRALELLFHDRTVIIIAHRQSSIRFADRVVVLDKGAVAAQGTHQELLATSPLYKNLMPLYEQEPSLG